MNAQSLLRSSDNKIRAPWRILLFIIISVALYFVVAMLGGGLARTVTAKGDQLIVFSWLALLGLLIATALSVFWIDGASWKSVRLDSDAARPALIVKGLLFGALAIGVPSVLLLFVHELRVVPAATGSWGATAWRAALLLLPAALTEELLLRGYIFAVLRETIGWQRTLVATSIAFGLLHLGNPGVDAQAILLVMIAGFFLGTIVIVTDSLYAAWMAHFAWNWTMAGALHTAVSGLGLATPDYRVVDNGPDWLTGGAWGPEGGAAAGLGMFAILFYMYGRNLGRLEKTRRET